MSICTMHHAVKKAWRNHSCSFDNWSLHFDKFVRKEHNGKKGQLEQVCKSYQKDEDVIARAITQRLYIFQTMKGVYNSDFRLLYFRNTSRLIVQMARSSILENTGMSFEPISGMPMVNGTGIKGAVSTWAIWEANGDNVFKLKTTKDGKEVADIKDNRAEIDPDLIEIFGDNSSKGENDRAGKVVFYGLFPLDVPNLGLDILTPHQERVLPNPFLVIEPGTDWLCPLRLMPNENSAILDRTEKLIRDCLTTTGLGAKTASGYGRFESIIEPSETLCALQKKNSELKKTATDHLQIAKQENKERKKKAELIQTEKGQSRFASMNDQELVAFVNQFQHEEGLTGYKWPGTLQEQYDLFVFCIGEGQARCTGKKQKKAVKNLTAKFGELHND